MTITLGTTPATPTQITGIKTDLGIQPQIDASIAANAALGAMAPAVQTLIDTAIQTYNTSVQSQVQTARAYAVQRANHTGTQFASTVLFASGETLESDKNAFLSQGTSPSSSAPNLTAVPTIAGTVSVGNTLTVTPGAVTDGSGGSHTNIYQWQRISLALGIADISGATATTYALTANDNGYYIAVKQTVQDAVTGVLGNTRTSALTTAVTGNVPTNAGGANLPSISPTGSATAGTQQYTSTTGTWANSPTGYLYQFKIAGANVGSNTSTATYTPSAAGPYGALTVAVTASNANGAGTPATSTTSVTVTAPAGTGHRWTDVTSAMWTEIETYGAANGNTNASTYRNRISGIPTNGGVTLNAGADIVATLGTQNLVFLNAGTYTLTGRCTMTTQKLICLGNVTIDARNADIAFNIVGDAVLSGGVSSAMTIINGNNVGVQVWNGGSGFTNGPTIYHISVDGMGLGGVGGQACPDAVAFNIVYDAAKTLVCSCEGMNGADDGSQGGGIGGNSDGFRASNNSSAGTTNAFVDCHAYRNTDDGFDCWHTYTSQYFYFCTAEMQARHPTHTNGPDGNGYKAGDGTATHYYYKCGTGPLGNNSYAMNRNGNTIAPVVKTPNFVGDLAGSYAGGTGLYSIS